MSRPIKVRKVKFLPKESYFMPSGMRNKKLSEVLLKVEELEAIRLKDVEGLNQEECAKMMGVSRQTFQNIIDSGRKSIAIALTEGSSIRIHGGYYTTEYCRIKCIDCGKVYEINYEQDKSICPKCNSKNINCGKKFNMCKDWCNVKIIKKVK